MASTKSSYPIIAQAETLLIYGIFLFLTGLAQIGVSLGYHYVIEKSKHNDEHFNFITFLPQAFSIDEIHIWYLYPSAALTFLPCFCCILYAICKRRIMVILICLSSLLSFISSSIYIGLLIIHTLDYWQTISSHRFQSVLSPTATATTTTTTISTSSMRVLVPFDEPTTFTNLALLITFTLALVQALLSMIGAVISCLWSPCCMQSSTNYFPIATNSHYAQTTPHRFENPQTTTLRNLKRHQQQETHRFIASQDSSDPLINGFLHKNPPLRNNYDDV